ncbi:MAG: respiratory nitrate reductase subunit gamma [Mangrovibacterium sp.]
MTTSDYLNNFFLGYLPYISLGVFVAGLLYRIYHRNNTIQVTSSQFISKDKTIFWGSTLFHYAIIMVFFGHIFGLLAPEWMYRWLMTNETKRMLAIVMGGLSGGVALIGVAMLTYRRFTNKKVKAAGKLQDYLIVSLILIQIALGLWGTYITSQSPLEDYIAMEHWAQGLVIFKPDSWQHIIDADLVYKLHIVNGFFICILFPFTKLIHMIMVPINYAIDGLRK